MYCIIFFCISYEKLIRMRYFYINVTSCLSFYACKIMYIKCTIEILLTVLKNNFNYIYMYCNELDEIVLRT